MAFLNARVLYLPLVPILKKMNFAPKSTSENRLPTCSNSISVY
jgi:hypothetical protein